MSTHGFPPPDARRSPGPDDREWQAQERARRDERDGLPLDPRDPAVLEYRLIARALRHPPMDAVPLDFAAQVARVAEGRATTGDRVERALQQLLLAMLAFVAVGAAGVYGASWWPAVERALPLEWLAATPWVLTAGASVALAWLGSRMVDGAASRR